MKGDTVDINQLFAGCIPRLRMAAMRLLHNAQDSEDALQDALLSAFRHLHQFQGRAQFATWVHTIVINSAKSTLRKQRSRPSISSLDEPLSGHEDLCVADKIADSRSSLDEEYEQMERRRILADAIQELPPRWRVVIRMYNIEGLQLKEIAAVLGLSNSAVKTLHFRASRRLLETVGNTYAPLQSDSESSANKPTPNPRKAPVQLDRSRNILCRDNCGRREQIPRRLSRIRESKFRGPYTKPGARTRISR